MTNRGWRGKVAWIALVPAAVLLVAAFVLPVGGAVTGPSSSSPSQPVRDPGGAPDCAPAVVGTALVLDNATPQGCFVFESTLVTSTNVSLNWTAMPQPSFVQVVLGPAIPQGSVACPLFVAMLYSGYGTNGSVQFHVQSSPPLIAQGCVWPYHVSASSNSSNATAALAPGESVVVTVAPAGPMAQLGCQPVGSLTVSNTSYAACQVALDWPGAPTTLPLPIAVATFDGVQFLVQGYDTADCSVVSVLGVESSGATYTFLIAPAPLNCAFDQPTVLSPDGAFGASWSGGSTMELLVRAS